jgi:hypothetical protein
MRFRSEGNIFRVLANLVRPRYRFSTTEGDDEIGSVLLAACMALWACKAAAFDPAHVRQVRMSARVTGAIRANTNSLPQRI